MDALADLKAELDAKVTEAEQVVAALKSARAVLDHPDDWKPKRAVSQRTTRRRRNGLDPRTLGRVRSAISKLPPAERGSTVAIAQQARLREPTVERAMRAIEKDAAL